MAYLFSETEKLDETTLPAVPESSLTAEGFKAANPPIVSSTQARDDVNKKTTELANYKPLFAIPGETIEQYQARLGQVSAGTGTGYAPTGTKAPTGQEYGPQGQLQPISPVQQGAFVAEQEAQLKKESAETALREGNIVDFQKLYGDFKTSIAERDKYRADLISSLKPGAVEKDLRTQLANIRTEADKLDLTTERQAEFERTRAGTPTQLATGRAAERVRQGQFATRELAIQEKNLIDRIGIEQSDRELAGKIAGMGLDSVLQDFDSATKIFGILEAQEQKLYDRARDWKKEKRDAVADVLENFVGINPETITPQMEAQITNALAPYGTSYSEVKPYLEADWSRGELDRRVKEAGIANTISTIASRAGAGTELTSKQTSQAIQLANSLKAHPAYVDMIDIYGGIQGVNTGLAQGNGFGDITAINAFQRMVDPGATVRSEDVVLLQSASAWIHKILSDYPIEKLTKGAKLPDAVRDQMRKTAQDLYETRAKNYNDMVGQQYKNLSSGSGIPFEYVGVDFPTNMGITSGGADENQKVVDGVLYQKVEGGWEAIANVNE